MHAIDITVREVTERKDKLIAELTALWEASVRATHTFLTPEGIAEIRGFVPQVSGPWRIWLSQNAGAACSGLPGLRESALRCSFCSLSGGVRAWDGRF